MLKKAPRVNPGNRAPANVKPKVPPMTNHPQKSQNNAQKRNSDRSYKRRRSGGRRKKRESHNRRIDLMKKIAWERVNELYRMATEIFGEDPDRANRYILHARKIAMAAKIRIPLEIKRYICHGCKHLLVPGQNLTVRIINEKGYGSFILHSCKDCGKQTRYIFKGNAFKAKPSQKSPKYN
jgi:RNase P subunit RPR2